LCACLLLCSLHKDWYPLNRQSAITYPEEYPWISDGSCKELWH
jgi:hypothetical protein